MGNAECCSGRAEKIQKARLYGSQLAEKVSNKYHRAKTSA